MIEMKIVFEPIWIERNIIIIEIHQLDILFINSSKLLLILT